MRIVEPARTFLAAAAFLLVASLLAEEAATPAYHSWTAAGGYAVEAEFVRLSFGRVHLKRKDTGAESACRSRAFPRNRANWRSGSAPGRSPPRRPCLPPRARPGAR